MTLSTRFHTRSAAAATSAALLCLLAANSMPAGAAEITAAPHLAIQSQAMPTSIPPGGQAEIRVLVTNVGAAPTSGAPLTITDALPAGLTVIDQSAQVEPGNMPLECKHINAVVTCIAEALPLQDTLTQGLDLQIKVAAQPELQAGTLLNTASVSGGAAAMVSASEPIAVTTQEPSFGFNGPLGFDAFNLDGTIDSQAGGHPHAVTASFVLNSVRQTPLIPNEGVTIEPAEIPKDVVAELPEGFLGDPQAAATCTEQQLAPPEAGVNCPTASIVGTVAYSDAGSESWSFSKPALNNGGQVGFLYNIAPDRGYPAQLGFLFFGQVAMLYASLVHTSAGYHIRITTSGVSRVARLTGIKVTVFGDPALQDGRHTEPRAFLTNPTDCTAGPLKTAVHVDSWQNPALLPLRADGSPDVEAVNFAEPQWVGAVSEAPPIAGCDRLRFEPKFQLDPTSAVAGALTGLTTELRVPQNPDPAGLATPALKDLSVTLPQGIALSPSQANGLQACSNAQIAVESTVTATCPQASQIGTASVHTPLLANELHGQLFLGSPECSPCSDADAVSGRLARLFIQVHADEYGVTVKVPGNVSINPTTGQLTATFKDAPQLPFDDLKVSFPNGPRAAVVNPPTCGTYSSSADLTPWSAPYTPDAVLAPAFQVTQACGALAFAPSFAAGTANDRAGVYSPLALSLSRTDADQDLKALEATLPPGVLAKLAGVPECGEAEIAAARASTGECPAASQIGTVSAGAGPGSDPYYVTGRVYLTGPYNNGPFGEVVITPAVAGPFNLGNVVVRGSIRINPTTAQGSFLSDPLPSILDGIPLHIRSLHVALDRPGFTFNATSCQTLAVNASVSSTQGTTAGVSSPYQAVNCATLPFKPSFSVSTQGATSKSSGASLDVRIATHQGPDQGAAQEANIHKVDVQLPVNLPSRLTTLQKACTERQFAQNPAGCPEGSFVGTAVAHTPLLPVPLEGPAILVSHGGAAFPDLVLVLQGDGVVVDLTGNTEIKRGITYSKFDSAPDAPFSSFELRLPEGPHSILGAYVPGSTNNSFCGLTRTITVAKKVSRRLKGHDRRMTVKVKRTVAASLLMPTTLTAQNGTVVTQATKIAVTGCPKATKAQVANKKSKKAPKSPRTGR